MTYIGVTGNLKRRIYQHRNEIIDGFTKQYHVHKLEYYEETTDVHSALEREKQLKRWSRKKKDGLISRMNPNWDDLYPDGIPRLRPASFARDDNG